ncbi:MAG TPA: NnrU family protein [Xanthomonadales bacterium]|nr:NnrU family protein [Xanthomonadales bacterium]
MTLLILGLVLFLGPHSVSIFAEGWRNSVVARKELQYKIIYSLASLAGLVLIVMGYGEARMNPTVLYAPPAGLRHFASLLMLPAFICFFAPYFPGRIKSALKHPQLVGVKLWAFSHLLANGMLADVVLFGSFLAWAVIDRISFKHRTPRPLPGPEPSAKNDVIVIVIGLAVYLVFVFWLHRILIGVPPFG